jgi:hypothetical protein
MQIGKKAVSNALPIFLEPQAGITLSVKKELKNMNSLKAFKIAPNLKISSHTKIFICSG